MTQFLSDEWMEEAAAAVAASPMRLAAPAEPVVLQYEVAAAPGGKRTYALRAGSDGLSLSTGAQPDATATMSMDYDVAVQIATGALSTQAAFMQGRVKLGGDVTVLVRQLDLFDGIGDVFAELRQHTEY